MNLLDKTKQTIMNSENNFPTYISKIIKAFGSEQLYFTFVAFNKEHKQLFKATFGSDNISEINYWAMLMMAKLFSGSVLCITLILRRFLIGEKNKIEIQTLDNRKIKIPKKEMYHFLFSEKGVSLFDEKETFEMQNTDNVTRKPLKPEDGIIYMSSKKLFEEIFDNKFDSDRILDKINNIGIENLRCDENEYLKSNNK